MGRNLYFVAPTNAKASSSNGSNHPSKLVPILGLAQKKPRFKVVGAREIDGAGPRTPRESRNEWDNPCKGHPCSCRMLVVGPLEGRGPFGSRPL